MSRLNKSRIRKLLVWMCLDVCWQPEILCNQIAAMHIASISLNEPRFQNVLMWIEFGTINICLFDHSVRGRFFLDLAKNIIINRLAFSYRAAAGLHSITNTQISSSSQEPSPRKLSLNSHLVNSRRRSRQIIPGCRQATRVSHQFFYSSTACRTYWTIPRHTKEFSLLQMLRNVESNGTILSIK